MVASGLSPRVRGNPLNGGAEQGRLGSIPASAGEPTSSAIRIGASGVYPRECGGTGHLFRTGYKSMGLSPRVRGNRRRKGAELPVGGSIPASAGEPR